MSTSPLVAPQHELQEMRSVLGRKREQINQGFDQAIAGLDMAIGLMGDNRQTPLPRPAHIHVVPKATTKPAKHKNHFSKAGLANIRRLNQERWVPCGLEEPCMTQDKKTRRMRVAKHRIDHPHVKRHRKVA